MARIQAQSHRETPANREALVGVGSRVGTAAAQRVSQSPYVVAQRKQLREMFGAAVAKADAEPVQFAGAYGGLLPEHDTYRESYRFGDKTETDFTYHHIIPENKLHDVHAKLKKILADDGAMGGAEGKGLTENLEALKVGGRKQWTATRAINLAFFMNKAFSDYGLNVLPADVEPLIAAHSTLADLFPAVRDLAMRKVVDESRFATAKAKLAPTFSEKLKDAAFVQRWTTGNIAADVATIVQGITLGGKAVFDTTAVTQVVLSVSPQGRKGSNKGALVDALKEHARIVTVADFFNRSYSELVERRATDGYLMKIVREKGLPKEDQDELEDVLTWNPGNIHRGPKSELREKADVLLDDGGEKFELAAVNLINTKHFSMLANLNRNLDVLINAKTDPPSEDTVVLARGIIGQMLDIQKFGLTRYKQAAWEEVPQTPNLHAHIRLVRNDAAISAAAFDPDVARAASAKGMQV